MIQLKNILQFKYVVLFVLCLVFIFRFINVKYISNFNGNEEYINGYIDKITVDKSKITILLNSNDKIIVNYYVNSEEELNNFLNTYSLGDYIEAYGCMRKPSNNTNFYMFNYRLYLEKQNIYYLFNADNINLVNKNDNILFYLKQKVINRISKIKYSKAYVYSFILGDDSYIVDNEKECYRSIGISHLFAISGMHIGFIIMILSLLFKRLNKYIRLFLIVIFIVFYLYLIDFSPSSLRASLQALYGFLNKKNRSLSRSQIVIFVFFTLIIYNPNYIYYIGFQISIIVSFFIAVYSNKINSNNKIINMFYISLVSFISTLPVIIYYFNDINFLSIFINIIFVPMVSYLLFPLCIITFIFPFLDFILYYLFNLFSQISNVVDAVSIFKFSFANVNIIFYILYYVFILLIYKYKKTFVFLIILLVIHYNILFFNNYNYVYFLDVGQGDSSFILYKNGLSVMIDTGGKTSYCRSELGCSSYNYSSKLFIPFRKRIGVRKIDYLILTHGDYDHMGEAINLVENFNVEKVIFNCGDFNYSEKKLIELLKQKSISYYSCINELNIDDNKLYFLNSNDFGEENDNSIVIYTIIDGYKFMFMGDASTKTEKDLLDKYKLSNIDVLKVGHHGSRTSSSTDFINKIKPNYSIISVGKNNKFGHPNKEVLNNLDKSKIYRTDEDGSIMFKIKSNKLKIETCSS